MNKDHLLRIKQHGYRVYSQGDQDGVIEHIFSVIGTKNIPPFCVEFGFNTPTLTGGSGSNVANLVLHKGWRHLLLDAEFENPDINLHKHLLSTDNICDIFKQYNVPVEPDYVSIDVDSIDLWLMKAILKQYEPRLISIEYNCNFPLHAAITHPNTRSLYDGECTYGASLKALCLAAREYHYTLVHVVSPLDAFFVRNDLIQGSAVPDYESFASATGFPAHRRATKGKEKLFLDYQVFIDTDGDLQMAQQSASDICRDSMVQTGPKPQRLGLASSFLDFSKLLYNKLVHLQRRRQTKLKANTHDTRAGRIELVSGDDRARIKQLLIPFDVGHSKARFGNDGDGGYVLSADMLKSVKRVYSLGISNECGIDFAMAEEGKIVYQYDKVPCVTANHINVHFKQLFMDARTLEQELSETGGLNDSDNMLLMDIEGGEYDIILNSDGLLEQFSQICLELHHVLTHKNALKLLQRLNMSHTLIHIHGNNFVRWTEYSSHSGAPGIIEGLPDLLELTYVRNDTFSCKSVWKSGSPTALDKKNIKRFDCVDLDWWSDIR